MDVLKFDDYKAFLRAKVEENQGFRGYQSQMAREAGCQRSFLSQVIHGDLHLTRDHAAELSRFWGHADDECEYFIGLVDQARTASPHLRRLVARRLAKLKQRRNKIATTLNRGSIDDAQARATYYSSWYWSAIHMIVSIPQYRTASSIASRLSLSIEIVNRALTWLEGIGLIQREGNTWGPGKKDIHLAENSAMTESNHSHWRARGMIDVQRQEREALHYTSVFAVSRADAQKIRDVVFASVLKSRELIAPSPEEELYCFCADFFRI